MPHMRVLSFDEILFMPQRTLRSATVRSTEEDGPSAPSGLGLGLDFGGIAAADLAAMLLSSAHPITIANRLHSRYYVTCAACSLAAHTTTQSARVRMISDVLVTSHTRNLPPRLRYPHRGDLGLFTSFPAASAFTPSAAVAASLSHRP